MVFPKVHLERIIVDKILLLPATSFPTIADVAAFVLVPTMSVQLVIPVKTLSTKAALGMSLEAALVDRAGVIVAKFLVLP